MNKLVGFLRQWRGITPIITLFSLFSFGFSIVRILFIHSIKKLSCVSLWFLRFGQEYLEEKKNREERRVEKKSLTFIHLIRFALNPFIHLHLWKREERREEKNGDFFSVPRLFHWDQFNKTTTTPYYRYIYWIEEKIQQIYAIRIGHIALYIHIYFN